MGSPVPSRYGCSVPEVRVPYLKVRDPYHRYGTRTTGTGPVPKVRDPYLWYGSPYLATVTPVVEPDLAKIGSGPRRYGWPYQPGAVPYHRYGCRTWEVRVPETKFDGMPLVPRGTLWWRPVRANV